MLPIELILTQKLHRAAYGGKGIEHRNTTAVQTQIRNQKVA